MKSRNDWFRWVFVFLLLLITAGVVFAVGPSQPEATVSVYTHTDVILLVAYILLAQSA